MEIDDSLCEIFLKNYDDLKRHALKLTKNKSLAEDITQEVYADIHHRYSDDDTPIKNKLGFLYSAIKFASFNELKKVNRNQEMKLFEESSATEHNDFLLEELILESISKLPSQRRQAFYLKRILHYKVSEIAKEMGLRPKTVENHITLAIKSLQSEFQKV